jgi:hypothetical protein
VLESIDKKSLGTRKKVDIYEGIDLKGYFISIFVLEQKSRFLKKNASEFEILYERLKTLQDHNYKKKLFFYKMPFCSLAQKQMKEFGWKLIKI